MCFQLSFLKFIHESSNIIDNNIVFSNTIIPIFSELG